MNAANGDAAAATDQGMAHLQAAAREMIRAARTLLDAAEQMVDDPAAVGKVVSMVSSVVASAASAATPTADDAADPDVPDDDRTRGSVQRIEVS